MMKTRLRKAVFLGLLVGVMLIGLVAVASAMSSSNFHLDWYTNLSGAGGGRSTSIQYEADFTIGQNAASTASSLQYRARMGYWGAFPFEFYIHLPLIKK